MAQCNFVFYHMRPGRGRTGLIKLPYNRSIWDSQPVENAGYVGGRSKNGASAEYEEDCTQEDVPVEPSYIHDVPITCKRC